MDQQCEEKDWYVRRDGVVRGPFTATLVTQHLLLGRIRLDDFLSDDQSSWQPASEIVEILPEEVRHLSSLPDYQRLVLARMDVDERSEERRDPIPVLGDEYGADRRSGEDRRVVDGAHSIVRHRYGEDDNYMPVTKFNQPAGVLALTLFLAVLVVVWLIP